MFCGGGVRAAASMQVRDWNDSRQIDAAVAKVGDILWSMSTYGTSWMMLFVQWRRQDMDLRRHARDDSRRRPPTLDTYVGPVQCTHQQWQHGRDTCPRLAQVHRYIGCFPDPGDPDNPTPVPLQPRSGIDP